MENKNPLDDPEYVSEALKKMGLPKNSSTITVDLDKLTALFQKADFPQGDASFLFYRLQEAQVEDPLLRPLVHYWGLAELRGHLLRQQEQETLDRAAEQSPRSKGWRKFTMSGD